MTIWSVDVAHMQSIYLKVNKKDVKEEEIIFLNMNRLLFINFLFHSPKPRSQPAIIGMANESEFYADEKSVKKTMEIINLISNFH